MSFETYQAVPVRLTLAEPDLRDALLILYCYSCWQYDIKPAQSPPHDCIQTGHPDVITKVEITAKCAPHAVLELLDELAVAFGHTQAFRAAREIE